jgi:hypothetical protein
MSIQKHKKLILQVGYSIEVIGNVTLAAAVVFGIMSSFIILSKVNEKKSNSSSHSGGSNCGTTNIFIWNSSPGYCHHRYRYDSSNYYSDLLMTSALFSLIGVGLAIAFEVYWVGITVAALWTAAFALSYLGRAIIDYALNLKDEAPVHAMPSAPPATDEHSSFFIPHATPVSSGVHAIPVSDAEAFGYTSAYACYEQPWLARVTGY